MQLLLWTCLLTASVTHLVRSTGPPIIPMHNFATWFIFTEDFNPQELRNQEAWPYLDSSAANILDAIFNLVRMSRALNLQPISLPDVEPYLCIHVVAKDDYTKDPVGEIDKLLARCNFVPANRYIFYYSGQKDRKESNNHLFASLYKLAVHMNKLLITDLPQLPVETLGLNARLIPYVKPLISGWAEDMGHHLLYGTIYSKRSYQDYTVAGSLYEGMLNSTAGIATASSRSRIVLSVSSLQTDKAPYGSFQYFLRLFVSRRLYHTIMGPMDDFQFNLENTFLVETPPRSAETGVYLASQRLIDLKQEHLLKDPVFMTRLNSKHISEVSMVIMQSVSDTIFIGQDFFGLNDEQAQRDLAAKLGFPIYTTGKLMSYGKRLVFLNSEMDFLLRQHLVSQCRKLQIDPYATEILSGNPSFGNPMPAYWKDCNNNNKSCSANLLDNDKCLSDHSEVLDTNCYLIKVAKLVKLKERLLVQANSNSPINSEFTVQSLSDGPLAHFFREEVFVPSVLFNEMQTKFPEIKQPGLNRLTPTTRCAVFDYLQQKQWSGNAYKCIATGEKTRAPSTLFLDMNKPFWSFVANYFDDYADYRYGIFVWPQDDTKEIPFFENIDGICEVDHNMTKPQDRAIVVLKVIKAWSTWVSHASFCPIRNLGDRFRDTVKQQWGHLNEGYQVWGLVLADRIHFLTLLITRNFVHQLHKHGIKSNVKMKDPNSIVVYLKSCFYASYFYQKVTARYRESVFKSRCNSTCQTAYGFIVLTARFGCADCVRACSYTLEEYANGTKCLLCDKLAYQLDGVEGCTERLHGKFTNEWTLIVGLFMAILAIIVALSLSSLLVVNASTPIVKASSLPITRMYMFGLIVSCLRIYVFCIGVSDFLCKFRRILSGIGFISRYMALTLYVARLRLMTGSYSSRSRDYSLIMRTASKFFDALGHARAFKIVSIVGYSVQAITTGALVIFLPEGDIELSNNTSDFYIYYRTCRQIPLLSFVPSLIFLLLAVLMCVQTRPASEFLRQDRKVFAIVLLVSYYFVVTTIGSSISSNSLRGMSLEHLQILFMQIVEVLGTAFILWKDRISILLFQKEKNTRENVTRLGGNKTKMPFKSSSAGNHHLSRMIKEHSARLSHSNENRSPMRGRVAGSSVRRGSETFN